MRSARSLSSHWLNDILKSRIMDMYMCVYGYICVHIDIYRNLYIYNICAPSLG